MESTQLYFNFLLLYLKDELLTLYLITVKQNYVLIIHDMSIRRFML